MSRLVLSLQTSLCQHTSIVLTHAPQDKKARHITEIYIYSELVQQLQTVTRALQTANSASTMQGEQLKYFQ